MWNISLSYRLVFGFAINLTGKRGGTVDTQFFSNDVFFLFCWQLIRFTKQGLTDSHSLGQTRNLMSYFKLTLPRILRLPLPHIIVKMKGTKEIYIIFNVENKDNGCGTKYNWRGTKISKSKFFRFWLVKFVRHFLAYWKLAVTYVYFNRWYEI